MHKIYIDQGRFDFIYNIPQIIFSFLISYIVDSLISYLSQSEKDIIEVKNMKKKKIIIKNKKKFSFVIQKVLLKLSIKFIFFFLCSFIIVLIFGFYVTCFCSVYKNTQIYLIILN